MMWTNLSLLAQAVEPPVHLERGGLVIMSLSIGLVLVLNIFCMCRILLDRPTGEQGGTAIGGEGR